MTEYWVQKKHIYIVGWETIRSYFIPDLKRAEEFKAECEKQTKGKFRILKVEVIG